MFLQNKYTNFYYAIIKNSKQRDLPQYYEKHHIIPKCLNGNDSIDNIANLTAREHFICHLLLTKMVENNSGIKFALHMMTNVNGNQQRNYKINSRIYDYIKKLNSEACSQRNRNRVYTTGRKKYFNTIIGKYKFFNDGDIIPESYTKGWNTDFKVNISSKNKGRVYYYNPETFETKAFTAEQTIPNGWIKGNPNADTSSITQIKGKKYFHNPITYEEKRLDFCPDEWVNGRIFVWITDGKQNLQYNKYESMLPGFRYGRTNMKKGK